MQTEFAAHLAAPAAGHGVHHDAKQQELGAAAKALGTSDLTSRDSGGPTEALLVQLAPLIQAARPPAYTAAILAGDRPRIEGTPLIPTTQQDGDTEQVALRAEVDRICRNPCASAC